MNSFVLLFNLHYLCVNKKECKLNQRKDIVMKRFLMLLPCVAAMCVAANANESTLVDQCINVLLGNEQPTTLMATNLDANHDGAITIDDVTTLIDMALAERNVNRAPAQLKKVSTSVEKGRIRDLQRPIVIDKPEAIIKEQSKKE
jgi:hypothetical protein